jgi:hypothetical protein
MNSGDIEGALKSYARSVEINRTASGLFNLGVTHYHLSKLFTLTFLETNCLSRAVRQGN